MSTFQMILFGGMKEMIPYQMTAVLKMKKIQPVHVGYIVLIRPHFLYYPY